MKILTKMLGIIALCSITLNCFATQDVLLELHNATNRELNMQKVDGKDNYEHTQVTVEGNFPSKIGPGAKLQRKLLFNDGVTTNIFNDRVSVTYEIVCPNGAGKDLLTIVGYLFYPSPKSITTRPKLEVALSGNHCTMLQNGDGPLDLVKADEYWTGSVTIIHS